LNDDRQEVDEAITKKFQTELVNLREIVDQERAEREESEKTIQEMLKSVFSKVKEDIELERHNRYSFEGKEYINCFLREETEETLMILLNETCQKINDAGDI